MPINTAILRAIEERMTALEEAVTTRRVSNEAITQALDDLLKIYGITAQTGEIIGHQRDQIQANTESLTEIRELMTKHHQQNKIEYEDIHGLMVQLRSLARIQVKLLEDAAHIALQREDAREERRSS